MGEAPPAVLHIITTLGRGGAEAHLQGLIRRQVETGCRVACVQLRGPHDWADAVRAAGAEVTDLQMRRYGDFRALARLRARLRAFAPDVIHAHLQPAEIHAALARKATPAAAYVITRHNLDRFHRGPAPRLLEAWSTRRADEVIGISEAVSRRVLAHAPGFPPERVTTIPYGVDLSPFGDAREAVGRQVRAELGLDGDAQVVGLVARLIPTKRADLLVEAMAELAPRWPRLVAVIAGDGAEMAALREQVQARGLGQRVRLLGERRDVPRLMQAFDVFAFPSVSEGFGLVLLEAMAARAPVIAADLPPMTDLVGHEATGLTCAPNDARALAAAIERLLTDGELARRLAGAGRRQAEAHSIARMTERTTEVYARALALRRSAG